MNGWNSLFPIPLEAHSLYVFSSLLVLQGNTHIIRIGRINGSKINICLDIFFFKSRSQIMSQEECQIFRTPFTTGEHLIGARFILHMDTFQR